MNRSRSVSRRPALRHREEESSSISSTPRSSRSRSTSMASSSRKAFSMRDNHDDDDDEEEEGHRSRSVSRSSGGGHHRGRLQTSSSTLSKSAGVLAGIGIAALVAHKFWPKGSGGGGGHFGRDEQTMRRGHYRAYGEDRDPQRDGRRSQMVDHHYQYGATPMRHAPRNDDGFGGYGRESSSSRRRSMDGRRRRSSWHDDGAKGGRGALQYTYIGTSPEQSSVGYSSRRHV